MQAMDIRRLGKNRVLCNAGWIISGRLGNKLLAFVVSVLTARYLGPGNYGLVNYALTLTTFFASLCTLGIPSVIVKEFLDHPEKAGTTLGTALVCQAASSFLSALIILGFVSIADAGERETIVVVALSTVGLLFQVFDTVRYWFQSRLQSKYYVGASLAAYAAVSLYKIVLMVLGKSVYWFALANSVDYIVLAIVLVWIYRRLGGPRMGFSRRRAGEILRKSSHFIAAGLMVSVYASTDKFMLKQMLDEASVGYYALASSLSVTWAFVLTAFIDSFYPGIVEAFQRDRTLYERKNRQLYAVVFYACVVMSLLISAAAGPIVRILYGEAYLPAVTPLRIVVWYTAFSYLGVARNAWMVCEDGQKYLVYIYFGAAVINVALNWIMIPHWGASGAAAASLLTQAATIALPAFLKPLRPNVKLMLDAVLLRDVFPRGKDEPE